MSETVSIIIPVFNGAETLPNCLNALQQQTHPPDEIIVVDDGSTDGTTMIAKEYGVTILQQINSGPAAARNRGAAASQGTLLLFTDTDCVPVKQWVEAFVAVFSDPTVVGAKGTYLTQQPELTARFVQQEYQDRYDRMEGQPQIDFVDTYSAAYRRDIFLQTGGFDTTFPTASVEDQEFSFRLAGQGYRLVYVPQATVFHQHNRSFLAYAKRKYWIGYWKSLVTQRYPAKLAQDSHTPQILKVQLGLAVLGSVLLGISGFRREKLWQWGGGLAWLGLLLSGWGLYRKIWQRDSAVLWLAPFMIFIRAFALASGFVLGNIRFRLLR